MMYQYGSFGLKISVDTKMFLAKHPLIARVVRLPESTKPANIDFLDLKINIFKVYLGS